MSEQKRKPGRPPGSKNKSLVNKTIVFRETMTDERIKGVSDALYAIVMNEEHKASERVSAAQCLLKYTVHSADVELITDAEAEKPTAESMAKAMALISAAKGS